MAVTNEFERDLINTSFLKRPGRVDMIVFQNVADCGDGYPGLQRAFRNYLHEGGMEENLDINTHDIINITNITLSGDINITGEIVFPTATIHSVGTHIHIHPNTGNADGEVHLHPLGTNTASFLHLRNSGTANYGAIEFRISGSVVSFDPTQNSGGSYPDTFNINNAEIDNINIGDASASISMNAVDISATQFGYLGELNQPLKQADSPTFVGLTLSADLVTTSTIDGINVADHDHSGSDKGVAVPFTSLSGDIVYTQLDSIVDTSDVGSANLISAAVHQHTDADGSTKIAHSNTSGRTVNDHHAQNHNHDGDELQLDDINSNGPHFDFKTSGPINFKVSGNTAYYLVFAIDSNIPYIMPNNTDLIYFRAGFSGSWVELHAAGITEHSLPLPIGLSTDKILNVKNIDDKLDHKSLPNDAYYSDSDGDNEGMKLGAMVLHLVKTVQELEGRIKDLER